MNDAERSGLAGAAWWLERQHSHDIGGRGLLESLHRALVGTKVSVSDDGMEVWMTSSAYTVKIRMLGSPTRAYTTVDDVGRELCYALLGQDPGAGLGLIGDAWKARIGALRGKLIAEGDV